MAHHSTSAGSRPAASPCTRPRSTRKGCGSRCSKLYEAGARTRRCCGIIEKNTRQPVQVIGDLRAQVAACRAGERGLGELLERYGAEAARYMDELQRVAERLMRTELAALPDGVYAFEDFIDGVGDSPEPLRIVVRVAIAATRSWSTSRARRRRSRRRQLPGRDGQRRLLLRHPRHRRPRDPELRGLHAADPRQRARGHDRQPGAAGGLRRARRHRLPRLRRDHGRARAGRAGAGDRRRRGRPDADRDRRLRRGAEAVRARPRCSSAAGARARRSTVSRASRTRSPTCPTSRSS